MLRKALISAGLMVVLAGPALADSGTCVQPFAPTVPNGSTAAKEQMLTALDEVKAFINASDNFQECVVLDIQNQKTAAAHDQKTLDQAIIDAAQARISTNQREKERVGGEYNAAVKAYSAAHPTPPAGH